MVRHTVKLASVIALLLITALAIPRQAAADDDDPPARVARLAFIRGSVSFQPAGTDDWVEAIVNRPVTTGDKLWADRDSRAELNVGPASVRIDSNTGFSFLNLSDNITQIQLTQGTLRLRVKQLEENETVEVDTPNLAFSVLRPGVYRINVNENGDATMIKVRSGEGEVTGGGSAYNIHAWQRGVFQGVEQLSGDIDNDREEDEFDRWCAGRDRHEDLAVSARYVSPDVVGYQDLDDYGGWQNVPEHGMVWFPHTTVADWAPYRYGHWAYISPWGYTWIDDAPWGFAPFHYGRWVNVRGAWGWVPCPPPPPRGPHVVYVRPVYAPALVAWVGGQHFGVGISVGWFPLGPREVYVPSYHVSRNYVNNVNTSNTTVNTTVINNYYNTTVVNNVTVNNRYVNQGVRGAVTATTHQAFTTAQPVGRNFVRFNEREVARAQVNMTTPAVAPNRRAVFGGGAAVEVPRAMVMNRTVVAKTAPPPPPVPFVRQQQVIQSNGGRPPALSQMRSAAPANQQAPHPVVRVLPPVNSNVQGGRPGQQRNPTPGVLTGRPLPAQNTAPGVQTGRPVPPPNTAPNSQPVRPMPPQSAPPEVQTGRPLPPQNPAPGVQTGRPVPPPNTAPNSQPVRPMPPQSVPPEVQTGRPLPPQNPAPGVQTGRPVPPSNTAPNSQPVRPMPPQSVPPGVQTGRPVPPPNTAPNSQPVRPMPPQIAPPEVQTGRPLPAQNPAPGVQTGRPVPPPNTAPNSQPVRPMPPQIAPPANAPSNVPGNVSSKPPMTPPAAPPPATRDSGAGNRGRDDRPPAARPSNPNADVEIKRQQEQERQQQLNKANEEKARQINERRPPQPPPPPPPQTDKRHEDEQKKRQQQEQEQRDKKPEKKPEGPGKQQ